MGPSNATKLGVTRISLETSLTFLLGWAYPYNDTTQQTLKACPMLPCTHVLLFPFPILDEDDSVLPARLSSHSFPCPLHKATSASPAPLGCSQVQWSLPSTLNSFAWPGLGPEVAAHHAAASARRGRVVLIYLIPTLCRWFSWLSVYPWLRNHLRRFR